MRRRQLPQKAALDDDRAGWAHFERVGASELRFVEWCPSRHGSCGRSDVRHGYRGSEATKRAYLSRGEKRSGG